METVTEERYTIDRIGNADWQIFDNEKKYRPLTYLLFATVVVEAKVRKIQFTLTVYDATHEKAIFERELWSAIFYIANSTDQYEKLAGDILQAIEDTELENPVELAYLFGGTVLSRAVQMPPFPRVH